MSDRRHEGQFTYIEIVHRRLEYQPNPDDDETYMIRESKLTERRVTSGKPLPKFPLFVAERTAMLEDNRMPGGEVPIRFEVPAINATTPEAAFKEIDEGQDEAEKGALKVAKEQLEEQFREAMKQGPGLWTPDQMQGMPHIPQPGEGPIPPHIRRRPRGR